MSLWQSTGSGRYECERYCDCIRQNGKPTLLRTCNQRGRRKAGRKWNLVHFITKLANCQLPFSEEEVSGKKIGKENLNVGQSSPMGGWETEAGHSGIWPIDQSFIFNGTGNCARSLETRFSHYPPSLSAREQISMNY